MKPNFQLKNAVLVLALAAAYPLAGHTAAGVAQFTAGDVNVRRGAAVVAVAKGGSLESGDSISTGPTGRVQIRFTDGGIVALQPNSQFDITRYVDANDGKADSFLVNFARGSMRAVTGLIGKRNRENYKVNTTTATVGIRGSGFSSSYNADGTLSVTAELDEIEVCTNGGCVSLTAGETALVVNNNQAPIRTLVRANLPTPAPRQDVTVVGNRVSAGGLSALIVAPPVVVPPVVVPPVVLAPPVVVPVPVIEVVGTPWIAYFAGNSSTGYGDIFSTNESATRQLTLESLSGKTQLNKYVTTDNLPSSGYGNFSLERLSLVSFGSAGKTADADFLGWGHWATAKYNNTYITNDAANNIHYVVGKPTSDSQMAALNGFTGSYNLLGGTTSFTSTAGASQTGSILSGGLTVNFGSSFSDITGSVLTKFGTTEVSVNLNSTANNARVICGNTTNVRGFFTGVDAKRLGLIFKTSNTGTLGSGIIEGAAGFERPSAPVPNVTRSIR